MDKVSGKLTVFFDAPFWVGVFERVSDGKLLRTALAETDKQKQKNYSRMADTGAYWDKFASIAGKLYLLRHIDDMKRIYQEGWHDFTARILNE